MEHAGKNLGGGIESSYKSWGEEQIARLLDRNGIAFQYEYPLALHDRGKLRLYYPDFTLPECGMILEYFGVNGNPEYDQKTRRKLKVYQNAGIDGLYLTRESLRGDWPTTILNGIEGILQARLNRFRGCRHGSK